MKKRIALFITTVFAVVALPVSTFAAAATTDVTGTVTSNGHGVKGAKVTVVCDHHAKTDTTDASGAYLVVFKAKDCPAGSHVDVVAKKKKQGGYNSGTATPVDTKLNVAMVNVSLPEFGLIGLTGAAIIGGGAFMVMRRRQLSDHQA